MSDNNMFQKNVKGYSHVNKSLFVKQPTNEVIPFTIERQLVDNFVGIDIPVKFTDINGSLYLCGSQLVDLFGVNSNYITQHLNNIYGEYLDRNGIFNVNDIQSWGVGISDPPSFLNIYQINVVYNRTENTINQHGGGGGSQQVLFYHHDMIVELAGRLNNNRARTISQYVKNLIHDYHKNMFVVHQDIDQYPGLKMNLNRVAGKYSPQRHTMADVHNALTDLFYRCSDSRDMYGNTDFHKKQYFMKCCHNTGHISILGCTALQIVIIRSNPNSPDFGLENFLGKEQPRVNELHNACNFLTNTELATRSLVIYTAISRIRMLMEQGNVYTVDEVLRLFTMFCSSPHTQHVGWNHMDYPHTSFSSLVDGYDSNGERRAEKNRRINLYLELRKNRHLLNQQDIIAMNTLEIELTNEALAEDSNRVINIIN